MNSSVKHNNVKKVGFRVPEWAHATGLSISLIYELIAASTINSVWLGAARIILTAPEDFLHSLNKQAACLIFMHK